MGSRSAATHEEHHQAVFVVGPGTADRQSERDDARDVKRHLRCPEFGEGICPSKERACAEHKDDHEHHLRVDLELTPAVGPAMVKFEVGLDRPSECEQRGHQGEEHHDPRVEDSIAHRPHQTEEPDLVDEGIDRAPQVCHALEVQLCPEGEVRFFLPGHFRAAGLVIACYTSIPPVGEEGEGKYENRPPVVTGEKEGYTHESEKTSEEGDPSGAREPKCFSDAVRDAHLF